MLRIRVINSTNFDILAEVNKMQVILNPYFPCIFDLSPAPSGVYDYYINYVPYSTWTYTDRLAYATNKHAYIAISDIKDNLYINMVSLGSTVVVYGIHELLHLFFQDIGAYYQLDQTTIAGKVDTVHYFINKGDLLGAIKDCKGECDIYRLQQALSWAPAPLSAAIQKVILLKAPCRITQVAVT